LNNWNEGNNLHSLKRNFTVMAKATDTATSLLLLSVSDLMKMKYEFVEEYNDLMDLNISRILKMMKVKQEAMNTCSN